MPLWKKTDDLDGAPTFLSEDQKDTTYLVDETEAQVESNRAKGIKTPGWVDYRTYTAADGSVRHKVWTRVAMKVPAVEAGDEGLSGNTAIEDATVADS